MKEFKIVPANKASVARRKPVYGVGVNDANYITDLVVDGRRITCPFYKRWTAMLERCYSGKFQNRQPAYKGCSVCNEWLTFSNFRDWMVEQDWKGKELDKDLLIQGNKVYSPKSCLFISKNINTLLTGRRIGKVGMMRGVSFVRGKYRVRCHYGGKRVDFGPYESEVEAHKAYCDIKYSAIADAARKESEPVKSALLSYKIPMY